MKSFALKLLKTAAVGPLALWLSGCGGTQYAADPVNPAAPFAFPGQTPSAPTQAQWQPSPAIPNAPVPITQVAVNPDTMVMQGSSGIVRVGDLIRVTFSDIPQPPPPLEIRIPDDGKVTLPWSVTVDARNKTVSQLQEEIRTNYVPRMFRFLTVNIKTEERFYFVGGEVRAPARQPFIGEITVLRAIDTAGGFTDFSNRKQIELRRATGQTFKINWHKAIKDPKLDLPVYPNDQIMVHKKGVFGF